jgi:hypothetical protein
MRQKGYESQPGTFAEVHESIPERLLLFLQCKVSKMALLGHGAMSAWSPLTVSKQDIDEPSPTNRDLVCSGNRLFNTALENLCSPNLEIQ